MENPIFKDLHAAFLSKKPHRTWIKAKNKLGLLSGKQRAFKAPEGYYRCSAWANALYPFPKDISMKTLDGLARTHEIQDDTVLNQPPTSGEIEVPGTKILNQKILETEILDMDIQDF